MIKLKNCSLEFLCLANVEVPFRQVSHAVVKLLYTALTEISCCCLQNSVSVVSRIQLLFSPEFGLCCFQSSIGVVSRIHFVLFSEFNLCCLHNSVVLFSKGIKCCLQNSVSVVSRIQLLFSPEFGWVCLPELNCCFLQNSVGFVFQN